MKFTLFISFAPSHHPCVVCNFDIVCIENKRIHYSVNLANKGSKRKCGTSFFLFLFLLLFIVFFIIIITIFIIIIIFILILDIWWKSSLLRENSMHYKEFINWLCKLSSILSLSKMPVFQGVAPWDANFTLSCVILLWDLATAHSRSGKELLPSYLGKSCSSGVIVV